MPKRPPVPVKVLRRPWRSILQRPSPWRRGLLRQILSRAQGGGIRSLRNWNSGYRAPWTAEMDCLLVEGLLSGVRKEILADTLGVDSGQIKQRFVALTPSGTATDYQRHVLEVLRERATVQGKAGRP